MMRCFVSISSLAALVLLCMSLASVSAAQTGPRIDPCSVAQKSSTTFFIQTGNFQEVIAGVPGKQIFICSLVFSGSATSGFNIGFAGSSSSCNSGFTILGTLRAQNDAVVSAGGGSSTQFTAPVSNSFCIELGGVTPLESSGWVTYVQH
jgi:hypothetical protein